MADGIESFSWKKNLARVATGFKSGDFFQNPNLAPAVNVVSDGWPAGVSEKLFSAPVTKETPQDPWSSRK